MSSHPTRQELHTPSPPPKPTFKLRQSTMSTPSNSTQNISQSKINMERPIQEEPRRQSLNFRPSQSSLLLSLQQEQPQPPRQAEERSKGEARLLNGRSYPFPPLRLCIPRTSAPKKYITSSEQRFEGQPHFMGRGHSHLKPRTSLPSDETRANAFSIGLENAASSAAKRLKLTQLDSVRGQAQSQSGDDDTKEAGEKEETTRDVSMLKVLSALEEYGRQQDQHTNPAQPDTYDHTILPRPESQTLQPRPATPNISNTKPPTFTASTQTTCTFPPPPHHTGICTPAHITHQICTHAIMVHSIFCTPVGRICGFHPQKYEVVEGVCPRCCAIPMDEMERMIKEKVDVAVKRARARVANGEICKAEREIDEVLKDVGMLKAVWEWIASRDGGEMGIGTGRKVVGLRGEQGLDRDGRGRKNENVDVGQKVVDAIEDLRTTMREWVAAGGEETEVRGRLRDILGVDMVVEGAGRREQVNGVIGRVVRGSH